ncbi:MAG: radical SAM protein [Verrucomicrobiae bacterium]|nr:radical SAM protein [Verrucomicrobiae bacterium]
MSEAAATPARLRAAGERARCLLMSLNTCRDPYAVFPLGLAHVDAALRQAGFATQWLDWQFEGEALASRLAGWNPDFVGISLRNIDDVLIQRQETFFDGLAGICQVIRRHSTARIVLGGSGFSIFPVELLSLSGAEYGLQGEAEETLPRLLELLLEGQDVAHLSGLVYRRGAEVVCNPPAHGAALERLPQPVRPAEEVRWYLEHSSMLNVQTQRGCAFRCCYCTYPLIEGRALRRRPAEEVAEEVAALQAAGARYFFVVDSVFNGAPEHAAAVCEALVRRRLQVPWGCFLRPAGLTAELTRLMARAGLRHVEFGTDSFSDTVLAEYGKHFDFGEVLEASRRVHEAGVDACHFLICGGPGETEETLEEGFANSQHLPAGVVLPVIGMRIYPRTPLHERAVREGLVERDTPLLAPRYYVAPGLSPERISGRLAEFARRSPRWITREAPPEFLALVERLRRRGAVGPLWSYYSWLSRFEAAAKSMGAVPPANAPPSVDIERGDKI